MKIAYKIVSGVLYIGISGELDECASKSARETLDAILDESNMTKVVLDMSELSFMDSTGIGVLIGRFKKLKSMGVPLMIANPSLAVDKLLRLSGIYQYMPKVVY